MAKGKRENIKLKSTESVHCYYTTINKANTPHRLELKNTTRLFGGTFFTVNQNDC